jgi:hypothetical protein
MSDAKRMMSVVENWTKYIIAVMLRVIRVEDVPRYWPDAKRCLPLRAAFNVAVGTGNNARHFVLLLTKTVPKAPKSDLEARAALAREIPAKPDAAAGQGAGPHNR